jgi:hypothetical protein
MYFQVSALRHNGGVFAFGVEAVDKFDAVRKSRKILGWTDESDGLICVTEIPSRPRG